MEMLSMGPGRRADDGLLQIADDADAEAVDLGVRSRPAGREAESLDPDEGSPDADTSWDEPGVWYSDHWLAGLLRPEVLGASGAAMLVLLATGLPVLSAFENFPFYGGPARPALAWSFVPALVAAVLAAGLGLGGFRQAARYGAPSWARITSGVAAVVGTLVALGVVVAWFAVAQADVLSQFR